MRIRTIHLIPIVLSFLLSIQPRANAIGFGDIESIISLGSEVFSSVTSGSFSFSSIGNIFSGVAGLSGNSTFKELGNITSSLGGVDFGGLFGSGSGGGDFEGLDSGSSGDISPETMAKIESSVSAAPAIFQSITSRNWGQTANGIIGLLGDLGVLNPQDASSIKSASSSSVDSNGNVVSVDTSSILDEIRTAKTPSEIYAISRKQKAAYHLATNNISQLVLAKEGQGLIANRQKESALGLELSNQSAQSSAALLEDSNGLYESQQKAVQASEKAVAECQKQKESLKALKCIAQILGISSAQLALLQAQGIIDTANRAHMAQQLKAIAAINKINGDHLSNLEIQAAAQTGSLSSINGELDQANEYKQSQERGNLDAATLSAQTVILPFKLDR
jgi:hypothetical protein